MDACHPAWPERAVVGLMAHEDPAFRVDDPDILRELVAATGQAAIDAGEPAEPAAAAGLARTLRRVALSRRASRSPGQRAPGPAAARRGAVALDRARARGSRARAGQRGAAPRRRGDAGRGRGRHRRPDRRSAARARSTRPRPSIGPVRRYVLAGIAALRRHGQPAIALRLATALLNAVSPSDDLPEWLTAAYARASLCRELGRDDEALEGFAGILALGDAAPANVRGGACYHSAVILAARGEVDAACARLEECLAALPGHAAARSTLERLRRA